MMMGGPGMGGPPHLGGMMEPNKPNMENKLTISWMDASWQQILNAQNVMDYFTDRRNPFYDSNSNNEIIKMQNRSHEMLASMTGIEYCLLYVQEPILYVVRKQQRHSPNQATPISDYYIVAGTIYQAPDLCSVVNSRLLSAVNHLQAAFDEAKGYAKYHPTKGYWWDFQQPSNNTPFGAKKITPPEEKKPKKKKKSVQEMAKEEPSSVFQRVRVDYLLKLLTDKFPPPQIKRAPNIVPTPATSAGANTDSKSNAGDDKAEKESIKSEKIDESTNRGIKRENPSSGQVRPGSGMDQSKKMKFG